MKKLKWAIIIIAACSYYILTSYINENLTTCLVAACIMVHMVKGRQCSAYTHWYWRLNRKDGVWESTPTIFNYRRRTWQIRLVAAWHTVCAIYSTRLALFIHGITSAKRTREVWPTVLRRRSSTQLIMYSLDTCIRYYTYIPIFKSQKGSTEALNFLAITS